MTEKDDELGFFETMALEIGIPVVSLLTAGLVGLDALSSKENQMLTKDDSREVERIIKDLSPVIGKGIENINNLHDSLSNPFSEPEGRVVKSLAKAKTIFIKGDHIAAGRDLYSHHGIYDGNGGVISYDKFTVRRTSLEEFAEGDPIYKVKEKAVYSSDEILDRARSRMGEKEYNLLFNNCENFATWCRCG